MGKATRWLKSLLGMKRSEKEKENLQSTASPNLSDRPREKKRWSFGAKSTRAKTTVADNDNDNDNNTNHNNIPVNIIPQSRCSSDAAWLRSYIAESGTEQSKHAIAVAAATAAAADAAVAAAQAAVAVVRLTSQGSGMMLNGKRDRWAAVKIQTIFRGYLARKALRALKGLVKIQALVRGFLVRKRAAATLHSMQALIRAQTAVRTQRARRSFNKENRLGPAFYPRKSMERFDEPRGEFHSKRLSTTYEASINAFDESPKIVEIDTYKPRSRSRRFSTALSECSEDLPYQTMSSPLPCPVPARISVPDCQHNLHDFEWYFSGKECKVSTAHSTPRLANPSWSNAPATPAKSVCGDSFFRPYSNFPSYMANTQSFSAKLRSHSAPKQRPEPMPKKRLSLNEIMAARNSISSVRMHRSYNQFQEEAF